LGARDQHGHASDLRNDNRRVRGNKFASLQSIRRADIEAINLCWLFIDKGYSLNGILLASEPDELCLIS
jgi:hypothetical protein